jgi:hypothetical protein
MDTTLGALQRTGIRIRVTLGRATSPLQSDSLTLAAERGVQLARVKKGGWVQ